jgi:KUP system potassium uptake protein
MVAIPVERNRQFWASAALACMGVVFGDIGTSPLYTLQVAAKAASSGGMVSPEAVLGIISLIFWSLIIVISIKYAILIMRADNHGEGGLLALLALVSPRRAKQSRRRAIIVMIGLLGATLLYGDGTITPAISVLSALEGLKIRAYGLDPQPAQSAFEWVVAATTLASAGVYVAQWLDHMSR